MVMDVLHTNTNMREIREKQLFLMVFADLFDDIFANLLCTNLLCKMFEQF